MVLLVLAFFTFIRLLTFVVIFPESGSSVMSEA